jgi:hypothetical protein
VFFSEHEYQRLPPITTSITTSIFPPITLSLNEVKIARLRKPTTDLFSNNPLSANPVAGCVAASHHRRELHAAFATELGQSKEFKHFDGGGAGPGLPTADQRHLEGLGLDSWLAKHPHTCRLAPYTFPDAGRVACCLAAKNNACCHWSAAFVRAGRSSPTCRPLGTTAEYSGRHFRHDVIKLSLTFRC